jgi:hypothetical protein
MILTDKIIQDTFETLRKLPPSELRVLLGSFYLKYKMANLDKRMLRNGCSQDDYHQRFAAVVNKSFVRKDFADGYGLRDSDSYGIALWSQHSCLIEIGKFCGQLYLCVDSMSVHDVSILRNMLRKYRINDFLSS